MSCLLTCAIQPTVRRAMPPAATKPTVGQAYNSADELSTVSVSTTVRTGGLGTWVSIFYSSSRGDRATQQRLLGSGQALVTLQEDLTGLSRGEEVVVTANVWNASSPAPLQSPSVSVVLLPPIFADTRDAISVTQNSAMLTGLVRPAARPCSVWFEYGTTTRYGSRTGASYLERAHGAVPFEASTGDLQSDTIYHFQVVLRAKDGAQEVSRGADVTFRTSNAQPPPQTHGFSVIRVQNANGQMHTVNLWAWDYNTGQWQEVGAIPINEYLDFTPVDRHNYLLVAVDQQWCGENDPRNDRCIRWYTTQAIPGDPQGTALRLNIL